MHARARHRRVRRRAGPRSRRRDERSTGHRGICDLVQRRGAAAVQPRRGAAAFVRVRPRGRRVHRRARGGPVVRDGGVGHRPERVEQPVRRRHPSGGAAEAGARRGRARQTAGAENRTRARLYRSGGAVVRARRDGGTADAAGRLSRRDGEDRLDESRRLGSRDLPRAVDVGGRRLVAGRRHLCGAAESGRAARATDRHSTGSSRAGALHHSQLRLSGAGRPRARGGEALCEDCAGFAARASHAVAHLHPRRLLAGIDRRQRGVGRGRPARRRGRGRTACDGLPHLRVPADGAGREGARDDRRAAGGRRTLQSQRPRVGGAKLRGLLRDGGDSRALRARTRLVGRGRGTRTAPEQLSLHRSHHLRGACARRRAHGQHGRRQGIDRGLAAHHRHADRAARNVLGGADRDSAARGGRVARAGRGAQGRRRRRDARRRRHGRPHGKIGGDAGPARAGARAAR